MLINAHTSRLQDFTQAWIVIDRRPEDVDAGGEEVDTGLEGVDARGQRVCHDATLESLHHNPIEWPTLCTN